MLELLKEMWSCDMKSSNAEKLAELGDFHDEMQPSCMIRPSRKERIRGTAYSFEVSLTRSRGSKLGDAEYDQG